jgi:hypothetical protein
MARKHTAVFGIYKVEDQAERAVDTLIAAGFPGSSISVLLPDTRSKRGFGHQENTRVPAGTAAGVTAGGVIGGTIGILAGVGALAIPGLGPLIAAGPIVAGLARAGVGGAIGGLVGALVGMGLPEYEATRYEGYMIDGGILLSVHCDATEQISRAKELVKGMGAVDVAAVGENAGSPSSTPHVA